MKEITMNKLAMFCVTCLALLFILSCSRQLATAKNEGKYYYACPVHPENVSSKPGLCLKCGMELERWKIEKTQKTHGTSWGAGSGKGSAGGCH